MEFTKAVKIVTSAIKEDKELRFAYQSNIAMAYIDSEHSYRKANNKVGKYLNFKDMHIIANNAANNFLDLWCKD